MLLILWLLTPVQATDRPLGAMAEAPSNNVGYMLPEFDLQGLSSNKEEQEFYMVPLPSKLSKFNSDLGTGASTSKETGKDKGRSRHDAETGLKDEEELALRLLGRKCVHAFVVHHFVEMYGFDGSYLLLFFTRSEGIWILFLCDCE